ncbi:ribbon-helix-helix domain-containing protein [Roseobacter sp. YSTF-M11]|uniref:Ribbon-helix-helix domain-containing protein n=1 Tax=Roseobacter insulae TaxID=2859783 RepID=A0A9X1K0G7_9RHOB|nr:ribbon-helix-helix domain-containing protein [Roseobacter insulae]MBW4708149.1 ribbon-helix-helix domain-containing protein [Roseobacter insulae]
MSGRPVKHSVTLKGHRTSISLEDEFWRALRGLASEKSKPINTLIAEIDVDRGDRMGLASAIRLYVLRDLQARLAGQDTDAR